MLKLWKKFVRFVKNEDGGELIEWAAIILIVVGLIVVAILIGGKMQDALNNSLDVFDALGGGASIPEATGGIAPP